MAHLSVATNESWKDASTGERKERTEYHRVVIFNEGLCRVAEQYLRKGSKIYLEGQLQTRKWQDQQGQDRYSTEVVLSGFGSSLVMLDGKRDSGEQNDFNVGATDMATGGGPIDLDDDIPFAPW